eukprot:6180812-Pleurochrysis_carterae.AAC.1
MYKWNYPVANLSSDGEDYTSKDSQNDVSFANHHPFPGHEPTLPGFDINHLAHQQPRNKRAAGFRSQSPDHSLRSAEFSIFRMWGVLSSVPFAIEAGDHARDLRQVFRRVITFMVSNYPFPLRGRGESCGSHPFPSSVGRCLYCSSRR